MSDQIILPLVNHRVIIENPGKGAILKNVEEPVFAPQKGEILISVEFCGVAMGDILYREGISPGKFPMTPGYDVVGIVVSTGPYTTAFKKGDRVVGLALTGGYTSYISLPVKNLVLVPSSVKPEDAVAAALNYTTAYQLLVKVAKLKAGDQILIHGAGGGVGIATLQLCKYMGIKAYGTVSDKKMYVVEQEGAIPINYQKSDFVDFIKQRKGKIDAVFDPIGGSHLFRSFKVVRLGGTLVSFGVGAAIGGEGSALWRLIKAIIPFLLLKLNFQKKRVILYTTTAKTAGLHSSLQRIIRMLVEKEISPPIAKIFALKDAEEAQKYLLKERPSGKVLLKP